MNAAELIELLRAKKLTLAVAESCTGGLIAKTITDVAGCSDVFMGGAVTYSNASKTALLAVDAKLIEKHGAVSAEVAKAMAQGARKNLHADVAVSVTGIAGPSGGTAEKPVGLVFIGIATKGATNAHMLQLKGTREDIRTEAMAAALAAIPLSLH